MFFKMNQLDAKEEIAKLKCVLCLAEEKHAKLEEKYEKLEKRYNDPVSRDLDTSSFFFDFRSDKVKAVSIERIMRTDSWNKNVPVTIIGYVKEGESSISERTFYCNQEQHEKLVKSFKDACRVFECMP